MRKILMLMALVGCSTWGMAQCEKVGITNYTAVTIDVGGEAVFPVFCPPDGDPEAAVEFGVAPGETTLLSASMGKQFYRIGAMSVLGTGSSIAPDWVGSPCDFAPPGPYFIIWDVGSGGFCKMEIY
ncbi:MAG: hypothetical protein ACFB10_20160 [Salibacteraceae bacterium]